MAKSDPAQQSAAQRLQGMYTELVGFKAARQNTIRRLFKRPGVPRSLYFWGGSAAARAS